MSGAHVLENGGGGDASVAPDPAAGGGQGEGAGGEVTIRELDFMPLELNSGIPCPPPPSLPILPVEARDHGFTLYQ